MTRRFLITTADERSWKFDRPVLFLGDWCCRYDRKHIWGKMDAIVAEPYGLEAEQRAKDLAYVQELSEQLLQELAAALNTLHNTKHTLRYWHILLGHWLQRYVAVGFNRYYTLEQALKNYDVSGTMIFDAPKYHLSTPDSYSLIYAGNDDIWNHLFYAKILTLWKNIPIEQNPHIQFETLGFSQQRVPLQTQAFNLKQTLIKKTAHFLTKLSRKHDAFIINSYLPRVEEIKLQFALGQCPQLWERPVLEFDLPDLEMRQSLSLDVSNFSGFERFIRSQLLEVLPTCYLEGYQKLIRKAESMSWPSKPQFVFTSNNYNTDEVFKAWVGSKVQTGTPYFIGQHGNLYGTELGSQNYPEMLTCDKFLTWGWTNNNPKNLPAFVFKIAGQKPQCYDPNGGLLLIELHPPHLITPSDSYHQFSIYQEEQFRFVSALSQEIQNTLTVRFHAEYKKHKWCDEQRWRDRHPHAKIETGAVKIPELIAQSRLVLHSYDSTGILETLALNIPTMCFWFGGFEHLLPEAKPYYQLLKDAGIFYDTPELAAKAVALRWNHLDEWWESALVQKARVEFCQQYARSEARPVRFLQKLLLENAT